MISQAWSAIELWLTKTITAPLFKLGGESISLLWLLQVICLLLLVSVFARSLKRFFKDFLLLKLKINEGNREVISTLVSLGAGMLGFIIVFQEMGLDLANLAVVVGGLGIGIGFGFQELTKNLVSGLTILGENKLKVGNLIEFNGQIGYIKEISIRSTVIRTFQGSYLIVPNTDLTSNLVKNWTYDNCQGRIEISVMVAYETDPLLVTEVLLASASMEEEVLSTPPPKVIFKGFGDNGLDFELWVWVEQIERRTFILSSLNFIIEYNFRKRGITIPFPQRDLWIRNPQELFQQPLVQETYKLPHDVPSLKDLLRQFCCFVNLNDLQLRKIIEMGTMRDLIAGEILVKQGEYFDYFCIVLRGKVDAIYETEKISNRLFSFTEGQYFGEVPLMLGVSYPTTMRAAKESTIFLIGKSCFNQLLNQYPYLATNVAEELAKRQDVLQEYQQKLKQMGLLEDEDLKNPVDWIRRRLIKIFVLERNQ